MKYQNSQASKRRIKWWLSPALAIAIFFPSILLATPYDGLYTVPVYTAFENRINLPDIFVAEGPIFISLHELTTGDVALLVMNPSTMEWAAFSGNDTGSVMKFDVVLSNFDFGNRTQGHEIEIEFDVEGNGFFTQKLIADSELLDLATTDLAPEDTGKIILIRDVPMTRISASE